MLVFLDADPAEVRAGERQPDLLAYSQHGAGQAVGWLEILRAGGTHPCVYVAGGSHANYTLAGIYARVIVQTDRARGSGVLLAERQVLGQLDDDRAGEYTLRLFDQEALWTRYRGHWGEPAGPPSPSSATARMARAQAGERVRDCSSRASCSARAAPARQPGHAARGRCARRRRQRRADRRRRVPVPGTSGRRRCLHAPPRQFLGPPERFHTISQLDPNTVARVRDHPDVANAIEVCRRLFPFRYEEVRDLGFFLAFGPEGVAGGCRPRSAPASRSRPAPS